MYHHSSHYAKHLLTAKHQVTAKLQLVIGPKLTQYSKISRIFFSLLKLLEHVSVHQVKAHRIQSDCGEQQG